MSEDLQLPWFTFDPSQRDDVNSGSPWSEADDADLRWMIGEARGVSTIALFLCRTEQEVRARARHFGHELGKGTGMKKRRRPRQESR